MCFVLCRVWCGSFVLFCGVCSGLNYLVVKFHGDTACVAGFWTWNKSVLVLVLLVVLGH